MPCQAWLTSAAAVDAAVGPIRAAVVKAATTNQLNRRARPERLRVTEFCMCRNPELRRRDASDE